jgi:carbonic anhydrase
MSTYEPSADITQRNIANQIHADDWSAQAVVEYALGHLNVSHVVIVGHTNCGGAAAAFAAPNPDANKTEGAGGANSCPNGTAAAGGTHGRGDGKDGNDSKCPCFTPDQVEPGTEPGLDQFLAPLIKLRWSLPENATAADLIIANVKQSVDVMASTNAVQNQWVQNKRVCVHGWLYDVGTGLLKDLGFSRCK